MKTPEKHKYRMNIYISRELAKKVRIAALLREQKVSEYVVKALEDKVNE